MPLEFIDLKRGEGVSSLEISDREPNVLRVLGNLPHNIDIAPRDVAAARKLVEWLELWIARNPDPDPACKHPDCVDGMLPERWIISRMFPAGPCLWCRTKELLG